jgi:hypothetical protein
MAVPGAGALKSVANATGVRVMLCGEIPVAQPGTVCAAESSALVWFGPQVNRGAVFC